jgi:hypothetical protein
MWLGGEPEGGTTGQVNPSGGALSEAYYTLSGIRLATAPENGVYIKRTVYRNQSVRTEKIINQ